MGKELLFTNQARDVALGSRHFIRSRVFGISGMERKVPGAVTGL